MNTLLYFLSILSNLNSPFIGYSVIIDFENKVSPDLLLYLYPQELCINNLQNLEFLIAIKPFLIEL